MIPPMKCTTPSAGAPVGPAVPAPVQQRTQWSVCGISQHQHMEHVPRGVAAAVQHCCMLTLRRAASGPRAHAMQCEYVRAKSTKRPSHCGRPAPVGGTCKTDAQLPLRIACCAAHSRSHDASIPTLRSQQSLYVVVSGAVYAKGSMASIADATYRQQPASR